jgi:predicted Zn-dependent protease
MRCSCCGYHSTVKRKTVPCKLASLVLTVSLALPGGGLHAQVAPLQTKLPQLGDAAREDLPPLMERKLGEQIMHDIRRDRDYLDDAPIAEYLNNFGASLLAVLPEARGETGADYEFFAVRDSMLNAFALPGGFIGMHSGLLIAAQTESELAGVMAHEIGHVSQRHIARQIGNQKQDALIPLAAMILGALAMKSSPDAAMGVMMGGQGLAIQRQLDYSRDAEREADRVGFQIMNAAGMDTSGMVAFFARLQNASRNYTDAMPASLRSHPLTTERIADIQARIKESPYRPRMDSLDFHLVRARARVLQDPSSAGYAETRLALDLQAEQQGRAQRIAGQYGLAFLALKQGRLADAQAWLDKARAAAQRKEGPVFAAAAPNGDGAALFASLQLDILAAPGQPKGVLERAVAEAELAHAKFPLSRGIARQYADILIESGRLDEATRFLRDQAQLYRSESKLHDLLAKAYARQGKRSLQHLALAESYALQGGLLSALDQLSMARKAGDGTFQDLAVIDARERELQERRRDEVKEKK